MIGEGDYVACKQDTKHTECCQTLVLALWSSGLLRAKTSWNCRGRETLPQKRINKERNRKSTINSSQKRNQVISNQHRTAVNEKMSFENIISIKKDQKTKSSICMLTPEWKRLISIHQRSL